MKQELWLIWRQPKTRRRYKVGILSFDKIYTFSYLNPELDDALKNGFTYFPGFEDLQKEYRSEQLFANIATRLPNPKRPDYLNILNSYDLDSSSSQFDILSATKGRLVTDSYEFVPVFDSKKIEFDIAGTRHSKYISECCQLIQVNDLLTLELDPNNEFDEHAIKVLFIHDSKKYQLGFVPRYYSKELTKLLNKKVSYSAMVESLNFESELNDEDVTVFVKLIFNDNC